MAVDRDTTETLRHFLDNILASAGFLLTYKLAECPAGDVPELRVEFAGPDVPLLLEHRAELLLALEHLGAKVLLLEPEEHDKLSFDAAGFKADRDRTLALSAAHAIDQVGRSGRAFALPPMSSRERRLLHIVLAEAGMHTRSEGEGSRRHLVVYPAPPRS